MQNPTPQITQERIDILKSIPYQDAPSPGFIIHTGLLEENCRLLNTIKEATGAKILLAQKGFSCFSTYPILSNYLDGTTSSGLHEALLAKEYFGKEIHVYSPAFTPSEIQAIAPFCHSIIFNSIPQLSMGIEVSKALGTPEFGLRVNPEVSSNATEIYNPCAPNSRLGTTRAALEKACSKDSKDSLKAISGLHFHTLCEEDADALEKTALAFEANFKDLFKQCKWLNFGGGHHITRPGYNIELLCEIINHFQNKYDLRVYLEPGEAVALHTGVLNTRVLDIIENGHTQIALLNTSATCHMPDVLEMPYRPNILNSGLPDEKKFTYTLGGRSCLAGDIIGAYSFDRELQIGDDLQFLDMAHYTMVKTTTFNGVALPDICLYNEAHGLKVIREFSYDDYKTRLS